MVSSAGRYVSRPPPNGRAIACGRGRLREYGPVERPLTPSLFPQAERGRRTPAPHAIPEPQRGRQGGGFGLQRSLARRSDRQKTRNRGFLEHSHAALPRRGGPVKTGGVGS